MEGRKGHLDTRRPKPQPLRGIENLSVNELWKLHKQSQNSRVRSL
jgi:hypothetical protein